jgi:Ca-activated chloride channel family protein
MKKLLFFISIAFVLTLTVANQLMIRTDAAVRLNFTNGIASPTVTPSPAASASAIKPTPPTIKDEDEVIKIDTELVNLNVRVVDRNNRPINNLQQKDFKIFEDGTLQQIDFFSTSEVPTNYALVVDNSGSIAPQLDKVIEAGKVFIDANRPGDESMVIRFIGRDKIEILQPFTSNRADLLDSLDQFYKEGGQSAIIDAVYLAVKEVDGYKRSKSSDAKTRRAIILVTDGEEKDSFYNEKQLLELLRESEVQIYVVGFVDELEKGGGFISKSPQAKAKALLEKMATESGGKAYFPSSAAELPGLAKEISSELRTQYSIGYIPSNDKHDGTYRSIKVTVADGPKAEKRIALTRAGRTADK